jgi:hypothetical protein
MRSANEITGNLQITDHHCHGPSEDLLRVDAIRATQDVDSHGLFSEIHDFVVGHVTRSLDHVRWRSERAQRTRDVLQVLAGS